MAVGLGGLITEGLGGDLNQQLANALAGQGAPNPGAAPSPAAAAPGQAQAQTYAPDPQNANTIALLLKVHQQDAISNDLNRNIQGIAAGFGTAQQQASKQAALANMGPGDDRLRALGEIEKITAEQTAQNNAAQFKAGAAGMAAMFPGMTPQQLQWLSSNPAAMNDLVSSHVRSLEPTDAVKNVGAAATAYAQSKGYDPNPANWTAEQQADVAGYKSNMLSGVIGGQTPVEKDLRNDIRMWQMAHPGGTPEQMYAEHPNWTTLTGYAADKTEATKTAALAATDRLQSKANLTDVEKTIQPINQTIDRLLDPNNFNSTVKAIQTPANLTTGSTGEGLGMLHGLTGGSAGVDPNTLTMKNYVDQLQKQLSGEGMKNMKNIRTQKEFDTISAAAGGPVFSQTASADQIRQGLLDLKNKFGLAHANAIAAAGGVVPAEYGDQINSNYLDHTSPLYNGATVEKVPDLSSLSGADADRAVAALPKGSKFRGPDGQIHTRN
jgi:hypothetical protein